MITLVMAKSSNNVVGNQNKLPWHIPSELKLFSEFTRGHTVLMGRITYESLPKSFRPLPNRINVVISSDPASFLQKHNPNGLLNLHCFSDLDNYLRWFSDCRIGQKLMVIGGKTIYEQAFPFCNALRITTIHRPYPGDIFAPMLDLSCFKGIASEFHTDPDARTSFSINTWERT